MIFIESPIFTEELPSHLTDEQYQEFQIYLAGYPDAGEVIQDTGGLRKVRWLAKMRGKRGGVRVIYYYRCAAHQIRMILIYQKGIKDDLTSAEKKVLRELNKGWQ